MVNSESDRVQVNEGLRRALAVLEEAVWAAPIDRVRTLVRAWVESNPECYAGYVAEECASARDQRLVLWEAALGAAGFWDHIEPEDIGNGELPEHFEDGSYEHGAARAVERTLAVAREIHPDVRIA